MAALIKDAKFLSIPQVCDRYGVNRSTVWRWIRDDAHFPSPVIINNRRYFRELDMERWEAARGGEDPDIPGRLHGLKVVSGAITDYQQLVDALTQRRHELSLSSIELDARSGMQEGYTSKLENFGRPQGRGMGPDIFPLWIGGLKVAVVLVEMPRKPRKGKGA